MKNYLLSSLLVATVSLAATSAVSQEANSCLVAGHRGNALYYPENTIAAYAACKGIADMFEIDLRKTSDGEFVSLHDNTLDRTCRTPVGTAATGSVESSTYSTLRQLDAGSWKGAQFAGEKIPSFGEIVDCARANNLKILIERKGTTVSAQDCYDLIQLHTCADIVIMQSFDASFCYAFAKLMPGVPTGVLTDGATAAANASKYVSEGCDFASCSDLSAAQVVTLHNAGLQVYNWTIDGASAIKTAKEKGIDAIITNDPATASGKQPDDPFVPYVPGTMSNNLQGYWQLDGNANDVQNKIPGSAVGSSLWTTGKFGQALASAQGKYVNLGTASAQTPGTNAITLSIWVKFDQLPSQQAVNYAGIFDSTADGYVIYSDKPSSEVRLKVATVSGKATRPGIPAESIKLGQWHNIVGIYDGAGIGGGMAYIYLDGVKCSQLSMNTVTTDFVKGQQGGIGADPLSSANSYFVGTVDDVAFWNRALSNGDVKEIYDRGMEGKSLNDIINPPSCVADWSLM